MMKTWMGISLEKRLKYLSSISRESKGRRGGEEIISKGRVKDDRKEEKKKTNLKNI